MRSPTRGGASPVLVGLIAVCVAVEALLSGADLGWWGQPYWRAQAYDLGALWPRILFGESGLYPLQSLTMFVSYGFLHAGVLHLAGNMTALAALGQVAVRRFGARRFLGILLVSAMSGGVAFVLLAPDSGPMVGASGALFGLVGALLPRRATALARVVGGLVVMNLVLWILSAGLLAWQAHLGGFVAGLALTHVRRRQV
jgi:rhomboid protease GluP